MSGWLHIYLHRAAKRGASCMKFYLGICNLTHCQRFQRVMVSVNTLIGRAKPLQVNEWIMDSAAFTRITSGKGHLPVEEYAAIVRKFSPCGNLVAAVSQDFMCEPFVLAKTGLTVKEHQRLTVERYDALLSLVGTTYLMPVLQGYWPEEYVDHIKLYGNRLREGVWVGVGSVCKRNSDIEATEHVLVAIKNERPDLRLHGFGLKTTALESSVVRSCLYSSDSMAWAWAARKRMMRILAPLRKELGYQIKPVPARKLLAERGIELPNANGWREAEDFLRSIETQKVKKRFYQGELF